MQHIFYLKIENDIHSARVTDIADPHHQLYHVIFEDGYENIFFTDVETGKWIEEDLGETTLAANFGQRVSQLNTFSCMPYKTLSWCRASLGNKFINFGFYVYKENSNTFFEIYGSNHKFLCSLIKNKHDNWEVSDGPYELTKGNGYAEQIQIMISILNNITG